MTSLKEGPRVSLLRHTPDPERTVALAARLCYSDTDIEALRERLDDAACERLLRRIIRLGHLSVLEHASFTFGIEGISRATSHQLVRHRIASYSQQSQRYVAFREEFDYIIPPTIRGEEELKGRFEAVMAELFNTYRWLMDRGVPAEDARYVLPNAAETKIIVTMNARELLHFFSLRCCERAQWEIREMAKRMLRLVKRVAPVIFEKAGPGCVRGGCPEGEMTCGRPEEIREEFKRL